MKIVIQKILIKFAGRRRLQKIFELLFQVSLRGMNFGNGGNFKESGELNVLKFISAKFDNESSLILFDVGGNKGNYSKELSEHFDNKATIHSFEPSKKTFEFFLDTTKNIPNIVPNNLGLSDIEHDEILYSNDDGSVLASLYKRNLEHFGISMDKSEDIKLSTIDSYCKKNNINRIHFLKLDIEGHELKALNGAKQMLQDKKIDVIQFEFGGCNIDSRTYFQDFYYLLKENYRIYRILQDSIIEIPSYKEIYEIFITVNYLAVKR